MDTIYQPLSRVAEAMQDFVRRKELRLLHVVTSGPLRLAVLEHIAAAEHFGANRSPFFVLEAPCEADDHGWTIRSEELRRDVDELRGRGGRGERGEEESAPPTVRATPNHARTAASIGLFGVELRALADSMRPPMDGIVIVLSPLWVRVPKLWVEEIAALTFQPGLAAVRWVIVDLEDAVCGPLAAALGGRARTIDARVNGAACRAEAVGMLAAMGTAPPGATGARLCGAAGPRELPPPRKTAAKELTPMLAKEVGLPEALADASVAQRLRALTLSAAHAMRDGKAADALRQQCEAQQLCLDAGLVRESLVLEIVLGGYALQGGAHRHALETFRQARRRAEAAGFAELAVQAQLAVAASLLAQRRTDEACAAYAEAGQLGAAMKTPVLAIEGYRMAGQLLAAAGKAELAGTAWRRALDLADNATALDRKTSTAAQVARALAALCRTHRLVAQAAALEVQAAAMEGPVPSESPAAFVETTAPQRFAHLGAST